MMEVYEQRGYNPMYQEAHAHILRVKQKRGKRHEAKDLGVISRASKDILVYSSI